ncbi:hypothetical protein SAMN06265337_1921 [Hymenobacter gelipurpurascens]|uniref:PKD/Chitinase domain-containing protein n=1 Tax=Hymenobacter gelipurpurascens TaxID=89968 RepID=A0A212TN10_9BACT|nr:GDSL-type esterase/lipase family protein [Hymenobacter gelipurpurascens]SNC67353.1 hypothetical protein SAMN06265337_1921 [Hymenobacter gelipurpurascens]
MTRAQFKQALRQVFKVTQGGPANVTRSSPVINLFDGMADSFALKSEIPQAAGFTTITDGQFGTHPEFTSQADLNAYLLQQVANGVAVTIPATPTGAQVDDVGNIFSHLAVPGYASAADYELEKADVAAGFSTPENIYAQGGRIYYPGITGPHSVGSVHARVKASGGRPAGQFVSNATAFTGPVVVPGPTLTQAQPASGLVGAQVILTGTNLTGAIVAFNGTAAAPASITATQIVVPVPAGATSGNITGTTNAGTATLYFTVTAPAANVLPVANAGSATSITLPTNSLVLNGVGTDADGTITGYLWEQTIGPNQATGLPSTQAQIVAGALVQGTYQFKLTVTDNKGGTGTSTVQITVNAAPVTTTITQVVVDGDSLEMASQVLAAERYPERLKVRLGANFGDFFNAGVDGQTVQQMLSDQQSQILSRYNASTYTGMHILDVGGGINDIRLGATAAQAYDRLKQYHKAAQAAGFKTVARTHTSFNNNTFERPAAEIEAERIELDKLIRAGWKDDWGASALVDLHQNAILGKYVYPAQPDQAYFQPDGIHFTALGNDYKAQLMAPAFLAIASGGTYGAVTPYASSSTMDYDPTTLSNAATGTKRGVTLRNSENFNAPEQTESFRLTVDTVSQAFTVFATKAKLTGGAVSGAYSVLLSGQNLQVRSYDGAGAISASKALALGATYNVTRRRNASGSIDLFVDSVLVGSVPTPGPNDPTIKVTIGALLVDGAYSYFFGGRISNYSLNTTALSDGDIGIIHAQNCALTPDQYGQSSWYAYSPLNKAATDTAFPNLVAPGNPFDVFVV